MAWTRKLSLSLTLKYLKRLALLPQFPGDWITRLPELPNRPIPVGGCTKHEVSNQLRTSGFALLPSQMRSGRPPITLVFEMSAPEKTGVNQLPLYAVP